MVGFIDKIKEKVHHHDAPTTAPVASSDKVHIQQRDAAFNGGSKDSAIQIHNTARSGKGVVNINWDDGLANDAQAYAQQIANEDKMHHSGVAGQGENLYWSSDDGGFDDAVNMWLKEGEKYHGEKIGEGNLADWGHYTQAMWSGSTNVGMGKARSGNGGTYIVARYTPQGNMMGQKPYGN